MMTTPTITSSTTITATTPPTTGPAMSVDPGKEVELEGCSGSGILKMVSNLSKSIGQEKDTHLK